MLAGLLKKIEKSFIFFVLLLAPIAQGFANDYLVDSAENAVADDVILLRAADKVISAATSPPDFQQSESIELPDRWQHNKNGFYGSVWYRIALPAEKKINKQWAICLPEVNMNAQVWLNETYLGSGGSMQSPVSRYWHSPLRFVFSPSDIKQENYFYIRVVAYANEFGQLGVAIAGERDQIENLYETLHFRTVTVHVISGALAAVYALFMSIVWWKRRDPVFFWGALVCGVWSVSSMNLYVVNPPIADFYWEKAMQIAMGWIPLLFYFFILRLNAIKKFYRYDKVVLLFACVFNVLIVFSPANTLFLISRSWHIFSMFFGVVATIRMFYDWYQYRRQSQFVMVFTFSLIAVCGLHDVLVQNNVIELGATFWLDYSVPLILLLIGYLMVSRFLLAVQTSEKLNAELEDRVQQAQKKIESDYEKIITLQTQEASNRERERIYRDMHDDMGAKLLSIVYKAQSDEMSELARSAMRDLRAIVSKKPGQILALKNVLDKWKQVSTKRFAEAGLKMRWQQGYVLETVTVNAETEQHLQRIQTEAVTNVIKHGKGDNIDMLIALRFGCLYCKMTDNGDYSDIAQWQSGSGISGMRYRVEQLKGIVKWRQHRGGGGSVSWLIPIGD